MIPVSWPLPGPNRVIWLFQDFMAVYLPDPDPLTLDQLYYWVGMSLAWEKVAQNPRETPPEFYDREISFLNRGDRDPMLMYHLEEILSRQPPRYADRLTVPELWELAMTQLVEKPVVSYPWLPDPSHVYLHGLPHDFELSSKINLREYEKEREATEEAPHADLFFGEIVQGPEAERLALQCQGNLLSEFLDHLLETIERKGIFF